MINKLEKKIGTMPLVPMTIIWGILFILKGVMNTWCNFEQSRLPDSVINGYLIEEIIKVAALNGIFMILLTLSRVYGKTHRLARFNKYRIDLQRKQFDTDLSGLMSTNIGKLNSNINTYISNKVDLIELIAQTIVSAMPLIIIIKKLYDYTGIVSVLVNIGFIVGFAIFFNLTNKGDKLEKIHKSNRNVMGIATDNLMNIRTLRYLSKKEFAVSRLKEAQTESTIENVALWRKFATSLFYCAPILAVLYNTYMLRDCKDISLLVFICGETYGTLITISDLVVNIIDLYQTYNVAKGQIEFLNIKSKRNEKPIGESIRVRECEFGYKDSDITFKADMVLKKGKRYSVTGESGQGKSTLANLLVGNLKPFTGHVDEVKTFYIHQDTEILDSTLRDNLCFGEEYDENELIDLINRIGLGQWFSELKDGFDTILGDRGNKVSSGQKQRINLIRALLKMKENDLDTLIILDEPTSNLDDNTEKLAVQLIDEYCSNTLLVITHRPHIQGICDYNYKVENHTITLLSR